MDGQKCQAPETGKSHLVLGPECSLPGTPEWKCQCLHPTILMLLRVPLPDPCTVPAQPVVIKQRATPAGLSNSDRAEVEMWRLAGVLSPRRTLSVAADPFCPLPLPIPKPSFLLPRPKANAAAAECGVQGHTVQVSEFVARLCTLQGSGATRSRLFLQLAEGHCSR